MNQGRPGRGKLYVTGLVTVIVAVAGVLLLRFTRAEQTSAEALSRAAALDRGPRVAVVTVARSKPERSISAQAEARAYASVTVYAKISGYLKDIRVDRGDHVQQGQVLAMIESPELDKQYEAALANARDRRSIADRLAPLAQTQAVSEQEAQSALAAADAAEANVGSLAAQKAYEIVRAPFNGTVTARYADPGALLQNATAAQTSARPLVSVSQTDRLRVTAYLDQRDAPFVHVDDPAEITLPEQPGWEGVGRVSRASGELDPKTRTMLVEVDLQNRDGRIVPGSFVRVALRIGIPQGLEAPVEALVLRGKEPFVAVVTEENRVAFRKVRLAGDDGVQVRVLEGLTEGQRVALNIGDSIADGDPVQPVAAEPAPPRR